MGRGDVEYGPLRSRVWLLEHGLAKWRSERTRMGDLLVARLESAGVAGHLINDGLASQLGQRRRLVHLKAEAGHVGSTRVAGMGALPAVEAVDHQVGPRY